MLVLFVLLAAAPLATPPPELAALIKRQAATRSVSGQFTQTRHWAALKDNLVSQGAFSFTRGGAVTWKTTAPARSELILDGHKAVMKYPDVGVTQEIDLSEQPGMAAMFDSLTAVMQGDLERLRPLYDVTVKGKSPLTLELTPRAKEIAKVVRAIQLTFDDHLNVSRVRLDEAGADSTEIAFRDLAVTGGTP